MSVLTDEQIAGRSKARVYYSQRERDWLDTIDTLREQIGIQETTMECYRNTHEADTTIIAGLQAQIAKLNGAANFLDAECKRLQAQIASARLEAEATAYERCADYLVIGPEDPTKWDPDTPNTYRQWAVEAREKADKA